MFNDFYDPRPEGVDAPEGVFVLLERASRPGLIDVLATPGVPRVLHMPDRHPPAPVPELYRLCHAELFAEPLTNRADKAASYAVNAILGGDVSAGAVGYAVMVGRHDDTRILAIIPDCGDRCLARVAMPTLDNAGRR